MNRKGVVETPLWAGMPVETRDAFFASASEALLTKAIGQPEDIAQ